MVRKTSTLTQIGNSNWILIPQYWTDQYKLKAGDKVLMDINEEIKITPLNE